MQETENRLVQVRKEFEKMGLCVRERNHLEAFVPRYFKRAFLQGKQEFLQKCGIQLVSTDAERGITFEDPALFIKQLGGGSELEKIPKAVLKELRMQHGGPHHFIYFWIDNLKIGELLKSNELNETDVLTSENAVELKKYQLKKAFHPDEARTYLLNVVYEQGKEYCELLNSNESWKLFCERIKQLIESEYDVLIDQRNQINVKTQTKRGAKLR